MVVMPSTVNGLEISHAVLSGGKSVVTAGQARFIGSKATGYFGLDFDLHGGHFMEQIPKRRKSWRSNSVRTPSKRWV